MWHYRELILNLAIVELKNRYQSTILGFFWSLLSPLLLSLVLYYIFRNVFRQEQNLAVNIIVGITVWRFFTSGTISALISIVSKANLVTKVYIPRQILVLSNLIAICISSLLELLILLPIIYLLANKLPLTILLVPIIHILYFFLIYGIGLFLAAIYVYFRDLNQIWEVLINVLFFCAPIIYPLSFVPEYLTPYYFYNPTTAAITIYRNLMVEGKLPELFDIGVLIICTVIALIIGTIVFSKLQRRFAEAI